MRNLPGAEEIKKTKSALHTHSHTGALLVTWLESLGKSTELLLLILPRKPGPKSDAISDADGSKKWALPKTWLAPLKDGCVPNDICTAQHNDKG